MELVMEFPLARLSPITQPVLVRLSSESPADRRVMTAP
jgi:hypothetical protein